MIHSGLKLIVLDCDRPAQAVQGGRKWVGIDKTELSACRQFDDGYYHFPIGF